MNSLWYDFTYRDLTTILSLIKKINNFTFFDVIFFIASIVLIFLLTFKLIPLIKEKYKRYKKVKDAAKRKNLIKQIALQKAINDEIEQEIEADKKREIERKLSWLWR